jgi:hypothetical protein
MVSVTDPYGRILGFIDRICCVNPIDNTYYASITTTQSTHTKHFTGTLVLSTSLETHTKYFTSTLVQSTSLEHSQKALH